MKTPNDQPRQTRANLLPFLQSLRHPFRQGEAAMQDYMDVIHRVDPTVNPAAMYAFMLMQKQAHLFMENEVLEEQIDIAKAVEANDPGTLYRLTVSYGIQEEFESWELRLALVLPPAEQGDDKNSPPAPIPP